MIYNWNYKLHWDQVKCDKGICCLPRTHKFLIIKVSSIFPFIHIKKGLERDIIKINILDKGEFEKWAQTD
jgi:hypothetical protein